MFVNCPRCRFLVALDTDGLPLARCPNCAMRLREAPTEDPDVRSDAGQPSQSESIGASTPTEATTPSSPQPPMWDEPVEGVSAHSPTPSPSNPELADATMQRDDAQAVSARPETMASNREVGDPRGIPVAASAPVAGDQPQVDSIPLRSPQSLHASVQATALDAAGDANDRGSDGSLSVVDAETAQSPDVIDPDALRASDPLARELLQDIPASAFDPDQWEGDIPLPDFVLERLAFDDTGPVWVPTQQRISLDAGADEELDDEFPEPAGPDPRSGPGTAAVAADDTPAPQAADGAPQDEAPASEESPAAPASSETIALLGPESVAAPDPQPSPAPGHASGIPSATTQPDSTATHSDAVAPSIQTAVAQAVDPGSSSADARRTPALLALLALPPPVAAASPTHATDASMEAALTGRSATTQAAETDGDAAFEPALSAARAWSDRDRDGRVGTEPAAQTEEPAQARAESAPNTVAGETRETAPSFVQLPVPVPTKQERRVVRLRVAAIAALLLLLLVQLLMANRASLAADANWRPAVQAFCSALRCSLPPWREPQAMTVLERDVRASNTRPDVLRVSARVRNQARWAQPWPQLQLTLSDANGQPVATRLFQPREYLGGAPTQTLLESGQTAAISMDIIEPGRQAVAFTFDFR